MERMDKTETNLDTNTIKTGVMQARITTTTTVTGKKLFYVVISEGEEEHPINIGERTYRKLQELQQTKKGGSTSNKSKK